MEADYNDCRGQGFYHQAEGTDMNWYNWLIVHSSYVAAYCWVLFSSFWMINDLIPML